MSEPNQSLAKASLAAQLVAFPEFARLAHLAPESGLDEAFLTQILDAAGSLAEGVLFPFNRAADAEGCALIDGRVQLAKSHDDAWEAFVSGGWTTIDAPSEYGGAGLPTVIHCACEELFNGASAAFGMLPTPMRCAVKVIDQYASKSIKDEWIPHLVAGNWGATICISEADAGSDVPRLKTRAEECPDGEYSITGEKMWISFGDHCLTERIGHMVLAKTVDPGTNTSGISLFLVPSAIEGVANCIHVRRIEEKLGLHGSPTCALGFDGAKGYLIGTLNRGLSQLFAMIVGMRLSVGSQGAGIANACADLAWRYAAERKQGGRLDAPAVPINRHGDVRRLLLGVASRAEMARGLVLTAALMSDLAEREEDERQRGEAASLLEWLLPITKNFCAEAAFSCASDAIQVLGGAGYTTEWPAEQYLRDARVLSIYEGTSGMQALDLVMRRVLGKDSRPFDVFVTKAKDEIGLSRDRVASSQMAELLSLLEAARSKLVKQSAAQVCYPFLRLASLSTTGWIALRLAGLQGNPLHERLAALGRHWLNIALPEAQTAAGLVALGEQLTSEFDAVHASNDYRNEVN
ncbi:acyl-CoA dehydrogenase family protein [Rhizorhapis sp.]|uniref:acyl-CoA dehydrogenase family protein n=1 Tax=Rhizorhapis sp. TaxID=1968842 RepID=UPI002B46865A|nr:acyl-CoA dehydrogenase family protein [Rhizorhapis sp.]HKR16537.1 acyl-CoA dehydrogenase family protein [Rhizorhapis sp.]